MDRYEEIKNIIEQYSKDYGYVEDEDDSWLEELTEEELEEFEEVETPKVNFESGLEQKYIDALEKFLGYELSLTYKWCLKNYGHGYIYGEEIYTICYDKYPPDKYNNVSDIIYNNLVNGTIDYKILVFAKGFDTEFCFAIDEKNQITGEYPIYENLSGKLYAKDFLEFLKRRILE